MALHLHQTMLFLGMELYKKWAIPNKENEVVKLKRNIYPPMGGKVSHRILSNLFAAILTFSLCEARILFFCGRHGHAAWEGGLGPPRLLPFFEVLPSASFWRSPVT
jgi:hypothetical protein